MDLKETSSYIPDNRRHPWERARARAIAHLLKSNVRGKLSTACRVLDIGSGDLYQARQLTQRYPEMVVVGLDTGYDKAMIQRFTDHMSASHIHMIQDEKALENERPFDIVLMLDVIEHIENDQDFLRQWTENESTGREALFVITVPAHPYLFSCHDTFLGHYRRYNRKSLRKVCEDAGLEIEVMGSLFFSLWLARVVQFSINKVLKIRKQPASDLGEWKGSKGVAHLISCILILDFFKMNLLRRMGIHMPGLSLWVVARRES